MEFRILGPLEVISDGQALDLGGAKQRALLAVLLLHPNQVVSRDRLIDALWEENPPDTAQKALQVHVSKLRKQLGRDRIVTKAPGYAIRVEPGRARRRAVRAPRRRRRPSSWSRPLRSGAGRRSPTSPTRRFARQEIGRLEERRLAVLEERIEAELALGRRADLIAELESLVAEHPLRERLRALLMLALYRAGRQAEALDVYQDARRALVDELGSSRGASCASSTRRSSARIPRSSRRATRRSSTAQRGRRWLRRARAGARPSCRLGSVTRSPAAADSFLLQGEPGIGKSRLADELSAGRRRGAPTSSSVAAGRRAALRPTGRGRSRSGRTCARPNRATSAGSSAAPPPKSPRSFPSCASSFRVSPSPEPFESDAARFRLFDSTAAFLMSAAAERPLVLVLDDLHAADEPSLLLLQYVASALEDSRILIVGTFRDLDPTVQDPLESHPGRARALAGRRAASAWLGSTGRRSHSWRS